MAVSDSARLVRLNAASNLARTSSQALLQTSSQAASKPSLRRKCRLPEPIAGYHGTILPILTADGSRLYFDRKWHPQNTAGENDFDDIWFADKAPHTSPEAGYGKPINLGPPLNTRGSDVLCSLAPDDAMALVYGHYDTATAGVKQPGFSIARRVRGVWQAPQPIEIENFYNRAKKYFAHLAPDNRTLLLAIEREDSRGGLDLYVSFRRDTSLVWTEPLNLGSVVNTRLYEGSPCLAADGTTLYFSSEGHGGYGAADIFMTRRLDDSWQRWSEPVNLGGGINAGEEDSSINLLLNGTGFYYVSSGASALDPILDSASDAAKTDTAQGKGLYFADMPDSLRPLPALVLTGAVATKNIPSALLNNALVTVAAYRVRRSTTEAFTSTVASLQSSSGISTSGVSSTGLASARPELRLASLSQVPYTPEQTRYALALPAGEVFLVRATLRTASPHSSGGTHLISHYHSSFVQLGSRINALFEERTQNFTLGLTAYPRMVALVNEYEQNHEELAADRTGLVDAALAATLAALDELSAAERAAVRIDITGHSCDIGSPASNNALSLRRAELIATALEACGVPRTQIRVAGMGERKPLLRASTEEARRQNRRVEISFVK